jgi:hypothetical protein
MKISVFHFLAFSFLFSVFAFETSAYADDSYTFIIKKQEDKKQSRWTLGDWLDTQNKMRTQDMWLAMHSPSPYEFFLQGGYEFGQSTSGGSYTAGNYAAGAFATIFGLEGSYEATLDTRFTAQFDLRIFGYHDQGTNITLFAGVRGVSNALTSYRNPILGVRMRVYLARYFGIGALYRHDLDATPSALSVTDSGNRYEAEAFIDFSFVQIFGNYFSEPETFETRNGFSIGARIYF